MPISTVWRAVATSRSSIDANHKRQRTYVNLTISTVWRAVATGKRAKTQKRSQCDLPARFYFPLSTLNSLRANGSPHRLASGGYEQILDRCQPQKAAHLRQFDGIRLAPSANQALAERVAALDESEFLIGQRNDISYRPDGSRLSANIHGFGIDFVAFHTSWIPKITNALSPTLAIGLPWWDHYLPNW